MTGGLRPASDGTGALGFLRQLGTRAAWRRGPGTFERAAVATALLLFAATCGHPAAGEAKKDEAQSPGTPAGASARDAGPTAPDGATARPQPPASPLASPLGLFGSIFASRRDQSDPYEVPSHSPGFAEGKPHAAVLELDRPLVELRSFGLLGGRAGGIELRALGDELTRLGRDRNVTSLVVRFGAADIDMPLAEELRAALVRFRRTEPAGRKIHCHADSAANVTYFAMTACDTIGLASGGELIITGAAVLSIHVKGALDRLGIEADFLHIGAFKGAAEPLTRDRPSPEAVETLGAILDERFATLVEGIAEGRRLSPARVRELVDVAVFPADQALAAGLVDQKTSFDSYRDQVVAGGEWTTVKLEDEPLGMGQLMQLLGATPPARPSRPHIALVYAVGNVVDGDGGGRAAARREIAPRVLGPALRTLAADPSVKAVVLRIDSGGGSALASESLWQALAELRRQKPVVVSMGGVAASGGYYIGCAATQIFASRTTLTGSIGVVGGKLVIGRAMGKLGITGHPIGRGKRAFMWSPLARWSRDERSAVERLMRGVYDGFVARVAEGRKKSVQAVEAVAQGRVWTGAAAARSGLIDRIGGLEDALASARELARLEPAAPLEIYPPPPSLFDLIGDLDASPFPLGLDAPAATADLAPREAAALFTLFGQLAGFRSSQVQTALLWPLVLR